MEKTKDKFLRELNLKRKREELRQKRVSNASLVKTSLSLTRRIRNANTQFLLHQVDKGFSPCWYVVLHLKEKERRVDIYDWEEDGKAEIRNIYSSGLHGYINKETTWEFSPILYPISDIIK